MKIPLANFSNIVSIQSFNHLENFDVNISPLVLAIPRLKIYWFFLFSVFYVFFKIGPHWPPSDFDARLLENTENTELAIVLKKWSKKNSEGTQIFASHHIKSTMGNLYLTKKSHDALAFKRFLLIFNKKYQKFMFETKRPKTEFWDLI